MIYYALLMQRNLIKIGYTKDPSWRLHKLQQDYNDKLYLIAITKGNYPDETIAHKHYEEWRVPSLPGKELYYNCRDILDYINVYTRNIMLPNLCQELNKRLELGTINHVFKIIEH